MTDAVEISKYSRKATVIIPKDDVEKERNAQYNTLRKEVSVPGFRKGKVTKDILKSRFGARVEAEVADACKNIAVRKIFTETPNILGVVDANLVSREDFAYEVFFDIRPQFENINWEGLEVEFRCPEFTDADLEKGVEAFRRGNATLEPLAEGETLDETHVAWVNAEALSNEIGGSFIGKGLSYKFSGEGSVPPTIKEKLMQAKVGDTVVFKMGDLNVPELDEAKKDVDALSVEVLGFKKMILPELDDDFVLDLGFDGIDTVDKLKEAIRKQLEAERNAQAETEMLRALLVKLRESNPLEEVPAQYAKNAAAQWLILNLARTSNYEVTPQMAQVIKNNVNDTVVDMFKVYTHDFLILDALSAQLKIRGDLPHLFQLGKALYGDEPELFRQLAEVPIVLSGVAMYSEVIRKIAAAAKINRIDEAAEVLPAEQLHPYADLQDILHLSRLTGSFYPVQAENA